MKVKLPANYDALDRNQRRAVRMEYIRRQNGYCHHCGNDLWMPPTEEVRNRDINLKLFPIGFLNYPVHLHHNHATGMTIGAIHARCNAVLWQYHGE